MTKDLGFIGAILAFISMFGIYIALTVFYSLWVMLCWNVSIPFIFDLPKITWIESFCLLTISNAFFKGVKYREKEM